MKTRNDFNLIPNLKTLPFKAIAAAQARVRMSLPLLLLAISLRSIASLTAGGDWLQERFDATHSAFNRFETVLNRKNVANLTQLWASQVGTGSTLRASPVVSGGKVFMGGEDGHMYAFDAATGATLWVGPAQGLFFVNSAAVGYGLVFASAIYSPLVAYDSETGAIAWVSNLTSVRASPVLNNRVLYVTSNDGTLTALDTSTGTTLWQAEGRCCVDNQSPVVDGGRVFQMATDGTLTAYNARTGKQLWNVPGSSAETLAASGGVLFRNSYPNVYAVDEATGAQLWTSEVLGGTTPTLAAGLVFVPGFKMLALDAATGGLVWSARSKPLRAVVANGVVYASAISGEWDAFDARNGSLLWSVTFGSGCFGACTDANPVVANGTLYLAGPDLYLRAYGLPR